MSVAFSCNGIQLVSGSIDYSVWVWNAVTGDMECVLYGHSNLVSFVAFPHDGTCTDSLDLECSDQDNKADSRGPP